MGDELRDRIARALRDLDEQQYPAMLTDDYLDALADAVLAVLPQYDQVGWRRPDNGSLAQDDGGIALHQWQDHGWVPVYIVRDTTEGETP